MNASEACSGTPDDVIQLISIWGSLGLSVLGILANVLCICLMVVFSSRWRRPFNLYLFTAYTCDVNFLCCAIIQGIRIDRPWLLPSFLCHHLVYASHVLSLVSQWCLWAASTERYMALAWPLRFTARPKDGCWVKKRDIAVVGAIFLLAFGSESWILTWITTDTNQTACCIYLGGKGLLLGFQFLDAAVSYIFPGFMIFACTISIRRLMRRYNPSHRIGSSNVARNVTRLRRLSLNGLIGADRRASQQGHEGHGSGYVIISIARRQTVEKRERRIASTLLLIAVLDAILNLQHYLVRTLGAVELDLVFGLNGVAWSIVEAISQFAYSSQFLLNVFYWFAFPYARGATAGGANTGASGVQKMRSKSEVIMLASVSGDGIQRKRSKQRSV